MTTLAQEFGFTTSQAAAVAAKGAELFEAGDHDGAAIIYSGLLAINPMDAGAHAALAAVLEAQGKRAEAAAELDVAIELDPSFAAWRAKYAGARKG